MKTLFPLYQRNDFLLKSIRFSSATDSSELLSGSITPKQNQQESHTDSFEIHPTGLTNESAIGTSSTIKEVFSLFEKGHPSEIVEALSRYRYDASKIPSDVNVFNDKGLTLIHLALRSQKPEIIEAVILSGFPLIAMSQEGLLASDELVRKEPEYLDAFEKAIENVQTHHPNPGPILNEVKRFLNCQDTRHQSILQKVIDPTYPEKKIEHDAVTLQWMVKTVQKLLSLGADPNLVGWNAFSPLKWAIYYQNFEIAQALLKAGADPNRSMRCLNNHYPFARNSPLSTVIQQKLDLSWAELLLKHGASIYLPDNETRKSALEEAIFAQKPEMIGFLIDQGADVNYESPNSFTLNYQQCSITPLHAAVINNDVNTAKRLIQVGADPNRATAHLGPALQLIFLREKYSNIPGQRYDAERDNNKDMLQLLLDAGTDLNPKDQQQSPFKGVLECWDKDPRRINLVNLLLDYGGRMPEGDLSRCYITIGYSEFNSLMEALLKKEKTAQAQKLSQIGAATARGNLNRVQNLQKHGFSLNAPPSSQENESLYHLAVESRNLAIVDYFLNQKLEPSIPFVQNLVATQNLAVLQKLALYPEYLHRSDALGRTLLHLAAKSGQVEMVKFLLSTGADLNRGDVMGKTPVMLAKQFGHQSVEALLQGASYFS